MKGAPTNQSFTKIKTENEPEKNSQETTLGDLEGTLDITEIF